MTLTASPKDNQAYAKLGGALDEIADNFTNAARALVIVDSARDPLTSTGRLGKAMKFSVAAGEAYSYVRTIQEALDEKKRDGALLKLGVKIAIDLGGKLLGVSLQTHPYFTYHKAAIDALADALNASRNSKAAVEAYRRAVSAANSQAVADEFKRLESRKPTIVASLGQFRDRLGVAADIARGLMSDDMARKKIALYGTGPLAEALADLETWRAQWAGLAFDAMQLQIMAGNELNIAIEAMNKVKDLMTTMMGGNSTSRVGGYGAANQIEWEKYDQIVGQKKPSGSLMDPVKYAQGNLDKATAWAQAFAKMCDFARTTEVIFSSKFNQQLDRLNLVLYG